VVLPNEIRTDSATKTSSSEVCSSRLKDQNDCGKTKAERVSTLPSGGSLEDKHYTKVKEKRENTGEGKGVKRFLRIPRRGGNRSAGAVYGGRGKAILRICSTKRSVS